MTTSFPPSAAEFQEPIASLIIRPLLQFLSETNSSFLINLYPYRVYRINAQIPIGFVLFQEHPFNFRDDVITGVRYWNLFDMMVDAVIAAMAVSGQENIPVIVAETGWPSDAESHATGNYAEMYLKGLITHLRSGLGTPLRKEGVAEGYIYQMFDESDLSSDNNRNSTIGAAMSERAGTGQRWGIMYNNMSMKYSKFGFSGSSRVLTGDSQRLMMMEIVLVVVSFLLFL
ncbi:glucan endo-1 3-beta-glucosidase acidic isoform gl161 [Phtheirospermum japonicum]|uniref:Glucan endo-1 3-beta-glucosidase acidic isoform gl161 n=1 Tax=Phtheirospermum japonicum TaxID=374723 RepID=A0A830BW00_9LAMI|nr:glucan endo-1 3-beta-glucosidase acidic isoform gl161 [Phtheirospermum japonicum]